MEPKKKKESQRTNPPSVFIQCSLVLLSPISLSCVLSSETHKKEEKKCREKKTTTNKGTDALPHTNNPRREPTKRRKQKWGKKKTIWKSGPNKKKSDEKDTQGK
eukprot:TRINITY_DN1553_c3_g1_i1.p3 TRINITY_DN1553_c3_g1~~TRINITY_DN1553_c3_g1_i1.p3  ORF type:complete len:104 (+),score=5.19 TRINITY_DN1553_c3_g1_i1:138-449(+)